MLNLLYSQSNFELEVTVTWQMLSRTPEKLKIALLEIFGVQKIKQKNKIVN